MSDMGFRECKSIEYRCSPNYRTCGFTESRLDNSTGIKSINSIYEYFAINPT